ncbi:MAG: DUF975 family protein [Clostridia bacterium]|nr:DUF975 family protein [Clostridia bacterium]
MIYSNSGQIKSKAKEFLKNQWGIAILSYLLVMVILEALIATFLGALILTGPLSFGLSLVYLNIYKGKQEDVATLLQGFNRFGETFLLYLKKTLFVFLWSLLLIIPGIVKALSYSMSYFLMAEHPEMDSSDALKESERLMDGHKGRLFCLNLSFIGWYLLSILTFGLLLIYVQPYRFAATVAFYKELKADNLSVDHAVN